MRRMPSFALALAALSASVASAATVTADFTKPVGHVRKELHSSGWAPRSNPRALQNDDEMVAALNMTYARTHDWALVNKGQRVIDYQYIFPLFHLDPKDPSNYIFEPTDHLLGLSRKLGLKILYRLGTSIEHTGDVHFNARVPADFEKTAEIFAGIIRHYNKGWANGHQWNIGYWEIWNEPDGIDNCWCLPASEGGNDRMKMCDLFAKFFVTCLRRLKSEFPDVKVGGPALCNMKPWFFRPLLKACKEGGVAPDFISWHFYGPDPDSLILTAEEGRKLCDEFGFTKCELIVDEFHYLLGGWEGVHGRNPTPAMVKRAQDGPTGLNKIDSACFMLSSLIKLQRSKFDQAYYYGCAHSGNWGYMDDYRQPTKIWYASRLFGGIVKDFPDLFRTVATNYRVSSLAARSADGRKAVLLISDYRGTEQVITATVKGMEKAKYVSAVVIDNTRDALPCEVVWRNGSLMLVKDDKNSAAFLVTFEL